MAELKQSRNKEQSNIHLILVRVWQTAAILKGIAAKRDSTRAHLQYFFPPAL